MKNNELRIKRYKKYAGYNSFGDEAETPHAVVSICDLTASLCLTELYTLCRKVSGVSLTHVRKIYLSGGRKKCFRQLARLFKAVNTNQLAK